MTAIRKKAIPASSEAPRKALYHFFPYRSQGPPRATSGGRGGLESSAPPLRTRRRLRNAAAVEALADPVVRLRLAELDQEIFPREQTPEALGALVKADAEKWWPIMKELGIKAE
jgi:hypothetical protein